MEQIWTDIQPAVYDLVKVTLLGLLAALAIIVPRLLGRITDAAIAYFERKTQIEVEQKWKNDLHQALESGTLAVIQKIKTGVIENTPEKIIPEIIGYTKDSVKGAIEGLKPSEAFLIEMALSKMAKLGV